MYAELRTPDQLKEDHGDRWANSPYVFVRDDGSAMHPDRITDWLQNFSKNMRFPTSIPTPSEIQQLQP